MSQPQHTPEELQEILREAQSRGTLIDGHPLILARRRSPDSQRDLKFQHIPRAGIYYGDTGGGEISSDAFRTRWELRRGI
jgi:hypothetical protein